MRNKLFRLKAVFFGAIAAFWASGSPCEAGWAFKTLMGQTASSSYQCTTATAIGPNGEAVGAWLDDPSGLAYAAVRRGASWGAMKPVYKIPLNAPEQIIDVRVAMGGDGTAIAAFILSHFDRYGAYQVVMAATMARGATAWSPAVEVSPRGSVSGLCLAADSAGNALAIWQAGNAVSGAVRSAGGSWAAPQPVPGCHRVDAMAMNADGTVLLGWSETAGSVSTIRTMTRKAGVWSTPAGMGTIDGPVYSVRVAIDGQGLGAAAWISLVQGVYDIGVARENASGAWDAQFVINDGSVSAYAMDFGMDAAGDQAIAWSEFDSVIGAFYIHGQLRLVNGNIEEQRWLTTDVGIGSVAPPSVALSPDGSLLAVGWIDDGAAQAFAATYTPAAKWSEPSLLGWGLYENAIALACGPSATASAVWPLRQPLWAEFIIGFGASTYTLMYPVPVLTSISPWMAKAGGGAMDILATGRNFMDGSATCVQWDGADRASDPVSGSNVVGHLTAQDLAAEGVHQVTVKTPSPGGGVSKSKPFLVDGTAPATAVILTGPLGENGWYTGAVQVKLTATDALSGVHVISWRVDSIASTAKLFAVSSSLTTLAAPKSVTVAVRGDGAHTVSYTSADNVSNEDGVKIERLRIDATPPAVTAQAKPAVLPARDGAAATVTVSGSIADSLSGVDPDSVQYTVTDEYGTSQPAGAITLGAGGAYSVTVSLDTHRDAADTNGRSYRIAVSAEDQAGLARTRVVQVTVR